ncbi:MAG: hypothetical protein FKY71_07240 [Spiribacter salinus]|uniref:Uncharacterized protein n=1 Tax=Spiribacter salinus TaxID=1335746 RepID=A0A540VSF2_9GAMM|nr:MAG: hypothetical protein FKY71_07240 [Spiribacter salinus]
MARGRATAGGTVRLTVVSGFALIGFVTVLLLGTGVVMDVRSIDQTRGGYEPPYTDFTGEPVRWEQLDTTATGMVHRGHVVDVLIDCSSGMMTFDVFGLEIPWRGFSERALVVHKPRDACKDRGFSPRF